jgi:hypothetical protein
MIVKDFDREARLGGDSSAVREGTGLSGERFEFSSVAGRLSAYVAGAVPVWMSHGVRGDFTDYRRIALVKARANWRFSVFPTGALPHFEVLDRFCAEFDRMLARP